MKLGKKLERFSYFSFHVFWFLFAFNCSVLSLNSCREDVCVRCPEGTFSNNSTGNCTEVCGCEGWCPTEAECRLCPAGTFANQSSSSACVKCDVGFVSPMNSSKCSACEAGWTSNEFNTLCVSCPPGTFSPISGSKCLPCEAGYYSPGTSSECTRCPPGSYNPDIGRGSCLPCGEGNFNTESGSLTFDSCQSCPSGFYCPFLMTADPIPCPSNYFCKGQSSSPSECPALFESGPASGACAPQAGFYILIIFGAVAFVALLAVLVAWIRSRNRSKPILVGENQRLIPPPKEGPVYSGL